MAGPGARARRPLIDRLTHARPQHQSREQADGYENLAGACRLANHRQDLAQFVRAALATDQASPSHAEPPDAIRYHQFQAASLAALSADSLGHIEAKNMVSWARPSRCPRAAPLVRAAGR